MASTSRAKICDLPDEMIISIFSFLPVADLARCASTCQRWHTIVTGFADLWKGKRYRSTRSPTQCAETRAVLHALPPLQEIDIESVDGFVLSISYPCMSLSLKYIRVLDDCPRLTCESLSTRLDIAGDILLHQSTIHFDRLRHLEILRIWPLNFWAARDYYSADYVVWTSLGLCPSLKQLNICADVLSAEYLDEVEGFCKLQRLEIDCPGLQKLSFLRHCSGTLEELQLVSCIGLPSRELTNLPQLQKLRKLQLSDCRFDESDLATAVAGLANLELLELRCCSLVSNLSFFQHCTRMQELYIIYSYMLSPIPEEMPESLWMPELRLPSAEEVNSVYADSLTLTAASLPAALCRLQEMGMSTSCLDYLGALRNCSNLAHVCCEFARGPGMPEMLNVRVHIIVTSLTWS